jgi:tetratricopeptide (TPR) repeat protein
MKLISHEQLFDEMGLVFDEIVHQIKEVTPIKVINLVLSWSRRNSVMRVITTFILLSLQLPTIYSMDNIDPVALLDSSKVYRNTDLIKSNRFLDEGLLFLKEHPNDSLECTFYYSKLLNLQRQGKITDCYPVLEEIKLNTCFETYDEFKFKYHYFASILQKSQSNQDSAIALIKMAETFISPEEYDKQLLYHSFIGGTYYEKDQYKLAIQHMMNAEELVHKAKKYNQLQHCNILHNLGGVFYDIGATDKAKDYLFRSLKLANGTTPMQRIQNLISLGILYSETDSLALAEGYYLDAQKENDFNPYLVAYTNLGLGELYKKQGHSDKAIEILKTAYNQFKPYQNNNALTECAYLLSNIYLDKENLSESKLWLNNHDKHTSKFEARTFENDNQYLHLKYNLLTTGGETTAKEFDKYKAGLDSINDAKLKREILEFEENKRLQQSVDSLLMLKAAVTKAEKELRIRNWITPIMLMTFSIIAFLLFRTRKKESISSNVSETESDKSKNVLTARFTIEGDKKIMTTFGDISSIQAKNGGIEIKLADGTKTFLWTSLTKYIDKLPQDYFVRVSKFHIVNIAQIEQIVDYDIKLKNEDVVKYSPAYKVKFMEAYDVLNN